MTNRAWSVFGPVDLYAVPAERIVSGEPAMGEWYLDQVDDLDIGSRRITTGAFTSITSPEVITVVAGRATVRIQSTGETLVLERGVILRFDGGDEALWTVSEILDLSFRQLPDRAALDPSLGWFGVRTWFLSNEVWPGQPYEERVTVWRTDSVEAAMALAEAEAAEYAGFIEGDFLGSQGYSTAIRSSELRPSDEVFSLTHRSDLDPAEFLDQFFDLEVGEDSHDDRADAVIDSETSITPADLSNHTAEEHRP